MLFQSLKERRCDGLWSIQRVKLLEHAMKIVERVLENSIRELVMIDETQFGFMPGKGTTQALFILRRMQEEFREEKVVHVFCEFGKGI